MQNLYNFIPLLFFSHRTSKMSVSLSLSFTSFLLIFSNVALVTGYQTTCKYFPDDLQSITFYRYHSVFIHDQVKKKRCRLVASFNIKQFFSTQMNLVKTVPYFRKMQMRIMKYTLSTLESKLSLIAITLNSVEEEMTFQTSIQSV